MKKTLQGTGLGLRREILSELKSADTSPIDFFEIAPENWIDTGGAFAKDLRYFSERFPLVCHGLSLSIGSADPIDICLLKKIKTFMAEHDVSLYTEHLSWCSYNGHLYDLLPIPCTSEAVNWVSDRIKLTQDVLEQKIAIENASYYFTPPGSELKEEEFISEIVRKSGCDLHLDINNVYVNSQNFGFDPISYLKALPLDKVRYMHIAGHYLEDDGTIVDTHGADVIDPVWRLLETSYELLPSSPDCYPICLERDFNFNGIESLVREIKKIESIQQKAQGKAA